MSCIKLNLLIDGVQKQKYSISGICRVRFHTKIFLLFDSRVTDTPQFSI